MALPSPLPDNPTKWDGWKLYVSENFYERLGLSFESNPTNEEIERNCRQLLVWWQKKLPLKNQPSNPIAQLLRSAMDEAPQFLVQARTELLSPDSRARVDERLKVQAKERTLAEFHKFLSYVISDKVLLPEDEERLYDHGAKLNLSREEMTPLVDAELQARGCKRAPTPSPNAAHVSRRRGNPADEFRRVLKLSGLDADGLTDDQRDALCNMGENLGLTGGQAEDLIDEYLDEMDGGVATAVAPRPAVVTDKRATGPIKIAHVPHPAVKESVLEVTPETVRQEKANYSRFRNTVGQEMLFVPSGVFIMGSTDADAAPNEEPVAKVMVSRFHISRFPVTNEEYEKFDPGHRIKRAPWADGNHPVIYVSRFDAMNFCKWLTDRERRKYRLPTEAEWELHAARGTDGRPYPWGWLFEQGNLANFADVNTTFPWRDTQLNDGYAETSPVGSYPKGASPFGAEDMSGNVWEWCIDFYEAYKAGDRINPKGPSRGSKNVYRGGSWKSRSESLRASARGSNLPESMANDVGFRIVCECD